MATEREIQALENRTARFEGMKVSWGGVWAGVLVVLGTLLLLTTLGLAIGMSAVTATTAEGQVITNGIGTGAAIWSAVSLLIALYLGGMTATRTSLIWDRGTALLQGALVWVMSFVIVLYLNAIGVGLIFGGGAGIVTRAARQLSTQPTASAWIAFFGVALSLLCALAGAAMGRQGAIARAQAAAGAGSYATTSSDTVSGRVYTDPGRRVDETDTIRRETYVSQTRRPEDLDDSDRTDRGGRPH
jgi:hypothetical protein